MLNKSTVYKRKLKPTESLGNLAIDHFRPDENMGKLCEKRVLTPTQAAQVFAFTLPSPASFRLGPTTWLLCASTAYASITPSIKYVTPGLAVVLS